MGNKSPTMTSRYYSIVPQSASGSHSLTNYDKYKLKKESPNQKPNQKSSSTFYGNIFKSIFPQTSSNSLEHSDYPFVKHRSTQDLQIDRLDSAVTGNLVYIKSGDQIRRSYMAKLITKNIWGPLKHEDEMKTIFIYDWDDTIFPTTFLAPNGYYDEKVIYHEDLEKIKMLEAHIYEILKNSIDKGSTYIVTNAAPGWVEYSCYKYFPKAKPLLNKISIISARGDFSKIYPRDRRKWKIAAFLKVAKDIDPDQTTNLICIGDSIFEMEAAHVLASKLNHVYIKTVKMKEYPTPEDIKKQIKLINKDFKKIVTTLDNFIIKVANRMRSETFN
jgi:hypothetical protein